MRSSDVTATAANEPVLDVLKRVLAAHEAAPLADMESLILMARENPSFRVELLHGTMEVLEADPAGLVPCWLVLIAGELGFPAFGPLLSALGTSEGEAVDETILPVLTRLALPAYDDITVAIEDSPPEDAAYRAGLYGVLAAVAISPHGECRESLRELVLRRLDTPSPPGTAGLQEEQAALAALAHLVAPDVVAVSGGCPLEGRIDPLRRILGEDWRDTARDIERRFGRP